MGLIYYHHANPIGNSDKEQYLASPTAIPYDCYHTGRFSDRIYNSRNSYSRFYVVSLGYQIGWKSASVKDRTCNRYTIHYVFQGSAKFNGIEVSAEGENVFVALPNQSYSIEIDGVNDYIHAWISLSGVDLEQMMDVYHLPKVPTFHIFKQAMEPIKNCFLDTVYKEHRGISLSYFLFSRFFEILSLTPFQQIERQSSKNKLIDCAQSFINTNYAESITVSDIAKALNISDSYLRKLFSKELQTSPQKALTEKRISAAKSFLKNPQIQISMISELCGFADQPSFSKAFKKQTGLSPSEFRESAVKSPEA